MLGLLGVLVYICILYIYNDYCGESFLSQVFPQCQNLAHMRLAGDVVFVFVTARYNYSTHLLFSHLLLSRRKLKYVRKSGCELIGLGNLWLAILSFFISRLVTIGEFYASLYFLARSGRLPLVATASAFLGFVCIDYKNLKWFCELANQSSERTWNMLTVTLPQYLLGDLTGLF